MVSAVAALLHYLRVYCSDDGNFVLVVVTCDILHSSLFFYCFLLQVMLGISWSVSSEENMKSSIYARRYIPKYREYHLMKLKIEEETSAATH